MPEPASYPGSPSLSAEAREKVLQTFRHTLDMARAGRNEDALLGCDFILKMDARFAPARRLLSSLRGISAGTVIDLADFDVFGSVPPAARPAPAPAPTVLPAAGPGDAGRRLGRPRGSFLQPPIRSGPAARASTTSGSRISAPNPFAPAAPQPARPPEPAEPAPFSSPAFGFDAHGADSFAAPAPELSFSEAARPPQATRSPRPPPQRTRSPFRPRRCVASLPNPRPSPSPPWRLPPTRLCVASPLLPFLRPVRGPLQAGRLRRPPDLPVPPAGGRRCGPGPPAGGHRPLEQGLPDRPLERRGVPPDRRRPGEAERGRAPARRPSHRGRAALRGGRPPVGTECLPAGADALGVGRDGAELPQPDRRRPRRALRGLVPVSRDVPAPDRAVHGRRARVARPALVRRRPPSSRGAVGADAGRSAGPGRLRREPARRHSGAPPAESTGGS